MDYEARMLSLLERMLLDESAEPTDLPLSLLEKITKNFSDDLQIGSGGSAVVYKGCLGNGWTVAVKKLSNTMYMDENKYNQEVACLMRVRHENIVRFLGYCADTHGKMSDYEGQFVMADVRHRLLCFEYLHQGSLHDYITDASRGLNWRERYHIIKGICKGLCHLHEKRIVHSDLKPANILLDDNLVPKICDFGLSRCFGEEQTRAITSKTSGSMGYMAPESFDGVITLKSDIYSLGVILKEILTGQRGSLDDIVLESWRKRLETSLADTRLEQVRVCAEISIYCVDFDPGRRPDIQSIIQKLSETEGTDEYIESCVTTSLVAKPSCIPLQTPRGGLTTSNTMLEESSVRRFAMTSGAKAPYTPANMKMKIHKYPPIIRDLPKRYTSPTVVAIGPYHHGQERLNPAERIKHVAAYHCIRESGRSVQELYDVVVSVAPYTRALYDEDVVAGIGDEDFLPMMFYDACFLVQYMLAFTPSAEAMDSSLRSFFEFNLEDIYHDILLLENQIPWRVVQAVMRFRPVSLEKSIFTLESNLQARMDARENTFVVLDESYEPPHFLGLFRNYTVGRSNAKQPTLSETEIESISFSVSAIELAEIGITLTPSKNMELIHMGVKKKAIFAELSLAPLFLDVTRASLLANMAALELCTTSDFQEAEDEESAVCSYLLFLAMIVSREKEVQELRTKHLLRGGGGFTNREVLQFLSRLRGLRFGSLYLRTLIEIESYKVGRPVRTKAHAFVYNNSKVIIMVCAIGGFVGFLKTLKSLKLR